jgi:hypothetical protein
MASQGAVSFSDLLDMNPIQVEEVVEAVASYHDKMNSA